MEKSKVKILVIGSVNQDLVIQMDRNPKPGETLFGRSLAYYPGGKGANQAIAAARFHGDVHFVGKIGPDAFGVSLEKYMTGLSLELHLQMVKDTPTGTAVITVNAQGENAIAVIPGANTRFNSTDLGVLSRFRKGDILLMQNEINLPVVYEAIVKAKERGMAVCYNPAPAHLIPEGVLVACNYVVVNEHELPICFERPEIDFTNENETGRILLALSESTGTTLILTLGSKGCIAAHQGKLLEVEGEPVEVVDTTGAGDCFCGAFVSQIAGGCRFEDAIRFANRAAGLSVTRLGASVSFPTQGDLDEIPDRL